MAEPIMQEDILVNFIVGDASLVATAKRLAEQLTGIKSTTEELSRGQVFGKMAAEAINLGDILTKLSLAAFITRSIDASNDLLKSLQAVNASAGMSAQQFAAIHDSIAQAASETGAGFGELANKARDLYGSTGLKEGLGQSILDAERLSVVFGSTSESFAKLTGSMIQFGEGAVKADDVMKSFDKVTGVTGKRMDDLLESVMDISKTMRNAVGGGKQFGESMKKVAEFSGQITSQFTELGGDGAALNELMQGVMDPAKWGEISKKMPGMAGHLYEMQQAMSSGDMERFGKAMKMGADQTAAMGANMPAIARTASMIDFTSAEILNKVDWNKIGKGAAGTNSVLERNAQMLKDVGTQWAMFLNNTTKVLEPIMMVLVSTFSYLLGLLNELMNAFDGWGGKIITGGIILVATFFAFQKASRMLAKSVAKDVAEVAAETGKSVGKAAGNAVGGFMESIGEFAKGAVKYALPMLQVAGALVLFAGAVWIMASAMNQLNTVDFGKSAGGLTLIMIAFAAFALLAAGLAAFAPMMLLVGASLVLFAGSVWIMAKAAEVLSTAFLLLGKANFSAIANGMFALAPALLDIFVAALPWASPFGFLAAAGLLALGASMAIVGASALLIGSGIDKAAKGITSITASSKDLSALSSLDLSGLDRLGKALQAFAGIKIDVKISGGSTDSMKALISIVQMVAGAIVDIVAAGAMALQYSGQITGIFDLLFGTNGILVKAVSKVNESLGGYFVDTKIGKGVQDSMTFITTLLKDFSAIFTDLTAMGVLLYATVSGGKVSDFIEVAINYIAQTISKTVKTIDAVLQTNINKDLSEGVMNSMKFVMEILNSFNKSFVDLAAMGILLSNSVVGGVGIKNAIDLAISSIFGSDGFINRMMNGIKNQKVDGSKMAEVATAVKSIGEMVNPLVDITSMGAVFAQGRDRDLFNFADTIGVFMGKMHAASGSFSKSDLDGLMGVSERLATFKADLGSDLKISTKTGAELALSDHTDATAEHHQTMEALTKELIAAVRSIPGGQSSPQVASFNGGTPAWRPEALFSESSETF